MAPGRYVGGIFLLMANKDPHAFGALLNNPAAVLPMFRASGDWRLAPIRGDGMPLVASLFDAAQTADEADKLFALPGCAGWLAIDCRTAGEAHPFINHRFNDENEGNEHTPWRVRLWLKALDLDVALARAPHVMLSVLVVAPRQKARI